MIAAVIGTTRSLSDGAATFTPLDRREHRDRGRDHAVAEEQRGAEDPEPGEDELRPAPAADAPAADQA